MMLEILTRMLHHDSDPFASYRRKRRFVPSVDLLRQQEGEGQHLMRCQGTIGHTMALPILHGVSSY
eukprot:10920984-Alexandrium_andersonii.AAC.1